MEPTTPETSAASSLRPQAGTPRLVAVAVERALRLTADEWIALVLFVLAVALRLWPLGAFSSEYDEGVYWQSLRALTSGYPLFSSVFSSQPPAFLLLVAPFYVVFGHSLSAARLGVALISLVGPVAFYIAGRALGGGWAGVLAGAFLAFDPLYLTESHTLQAEAPALGWLCLAVALAVLVPRTVDARRSRALAFGAGLFLALGVLTKLFDVVGIVPIICYLGQPLWPTFLGADGRPRVPPSDMLRQRLAELGPTALAAVLGALLMAAVVLLPFVGRWGVLWSQVVAFHLAAASAASHGVRYNLGLLATTLIGDVLLPLAVVAVALVLLRGHPQETYSGTGAPTDLSPLPPALRAAAAPSDSRPIPRPLRGSRVRPQTGGGSVAPARHTAFPMTSYGVARGRRMWTFVPPALWAVAALLFLGKEQPLFVHDITLIAPPLALLAALALATAVAPVTSDGRGMMRGALLSPQAVRSVALSLTTIAVAGGVFLGAGADLTATRYLPIAEVQMAVALDANTPQADVIITDDPYAAALADRAVPPQLVDASSVRIASGYLTAAQLEHIITQDDARTVLFGSGRFAQIPGFQAWVAARFQKAGTFGGGRVLYVKMPVQDQPV